MAAAALALRAGPVEFGMREVESAIAARGLRPGAIRFTTEVSPDSAETFRIVAGRIEGGDLRGLMYGLLTAAEQIRATGRLSQQKGAPATPLRGVRFVFDDYEQKPDWFYSEERWREFIRMLARNRFNRFHMVFAQPPGGMSPPYPYWVSIPEFPEVRMRGLSEWQRRRNLAMLKFISNTCAEHAVDFTLGIWRGDGHREATAVLGLNAENIGPYTHAAIKQVLAECPRIRGLQVQPGSGRAAELHDKNVFQAVAEAGRRVMLELGGAAPSRGVQESAHGFGAPLRVPVDYWRDWSERSRAARSWDVFEKPRRHGVYWDVKAPAGCGEFLWGDVEYTRRAVTTFTASETEGFEIDSPSPRDRADAWQFGLLLGRLGYDPKTPDKIWTPDMQRRFGAASGDALAMYRQASRVCVAMAQQAPVKPSPAEAAVRFNETADAIERYRGRNGLAGLEGAARLARAYGRKVVVDDHLAYFDETGDPAALEAARSALGEAASSDRGELARIEERERIHARLGRFDRGFDFGSALNEDAAAPRFQRVAPHTRYLETRGYGWVGEGAREARPIAKTAAHDRLLSDSIRGQGRQVFRVKTGPGEFTVLLVHPSGNVETRRLRAHNGAVDVVFGEAAWEVCAVVIKSAHAAAPYPPRVRPRLAPKPLITHTPPKNAVAGKPLALALRVTPSTNAAAIRLHYGPVSLREPLRSIENPPTKTTFTIPATELSARWDLMYYFEVVSKEKTSWADPDPESAPPYYVIAVRAQ